MTAASTELPLPTYVQVTNLSNGKKIIVKVNDRGPFKCKRIMDLSYAAAKKLGFSGKGTARVRVVAINPRVWNAQKSVASTQSTVAQVYIQIGSYTDSNDANKTSNRVTKLTSRPTYVIHDGNFYHVQVGPFSSATQSKQIKNLFTKRGFHDVTIVSG